MRINCIILFLALFSFAEAQNNWIQKADFGGGLRTNATGFSIGYKGYIMSGGNSVAAQNDFWEYDTLANTWTQKANLPGAARESAVSFAIGNKGYFGTGCDWSGIFYKDFYQYDPSTNTWTQKANVGGPERISAVGFSIGGKGYIGTGTQFSGTKLTDFWEYDTTANAWTQKAFFAGTARYAAIGFSIGNKGYLGGGNDPTGSPTDFWEYNPATDAWTEKAHMIVSEPNTCLGFASATVGYVLSGSSGAGSDFSSYNPATNTWTLLANLATMRNKPAGFAIGNCGYAGTGQDGMGRRQDFWKYIPCATIPSAAITAGGPLTFCAGDSVQLTVSPGDHYMWWEGDTTQSIWVTQTGLYGVTVYTDCGTSTASPVQVTVTAMPSTPTITPYNDSTLRSSATTGNQWYVNGVLIPGATQQNCVAHQNGYFTVMVTNGSGCSSQLSLPYHYTTFAIEKLTNTQIVHVFPNPFSDHFTIEIPGNSGKAELECTVYNHFGQQVLNAKSNFGSKLTISRGALPAGIYFYRLKSEGKTIASGKITAM